MALPLVPIRDRLEVHPQAVSIGKYQIPAGVMRSAHIDADRKDVRLWCGKGAMGHDGEVILDFHLLTSSRVKTFVEGLLNRTGAYLLWIHLLTARVLRNQDAAAIRAEFVLRDCNEAQVFCDYVAPVYFPGSSSILNDRSVAVLTEPGSEADVASRMKRAFISLNAHTNNSLQQALSNDPHAPFQIAPLPPFMPDEVCSFRQSPLYTITPHLVQKEIHPQLKPLTFNRETAEKYGRQLVELDKMLSHSELESCFLSLIFLVKQGLARAPQDEVEMETVRNRFRCFLEVNETLPPEIRNFIERFLIY